jgi:hypothetical protein
MNQLIAPYSQSNRVVVSVTPFESLYFWNGHKGLTLRVSNANENTFAGESFTDLINNAVIYMLQGVHPQKAFDQIREDEIEKPGK